MSKKLVVIGGGAAGFFCAVNAARMHPGLEVILLEKTGKLLSKVKVSGGGRCNVTHACFDIAAMSRCYPRGSNLVKKTFHHFFTTDTIQWFEQRGVPLKAEPDGRMFPVSDSSQSVIDCLLKEASRYRVDIRMNAEVSTLTAADNGFHIILAGGKTLQTDFACIACGGYPKSAMFNWLRQTGHTIEEPVPSLFTFNIPGHPITGLMGVTVSRAKVRVAGSKLGQEGPVLITHWGLSGPAILRLSAWGARELQRAAYQFTALVNWIPDYTEQALRDHLQQLRFEKAAQKIMGRNVFGLPQRLWEFLLQQSGIIADIRWADLAAKEQNRLIRNLCSFELEVKGKTTFKEEFVTAGGISLAEIDAATMMSRKVPGLFFAGEVLDVDGITGGYNFQHAWTSGWLAARSLSQ